MDVPVGGISHDDPPPQTPNDKPLNEVLIGGGHTTTKQQITWMDSPLVKDVGANTIIKRLLKKCNIDFFGRV